MNVGRMARGVATMITRKVEITDRRHVIQPRRMNGI